MRVSIENAVGFVFIVCMTVNVAAQIVLPAVDGVPAEASAKSVSQDLPFFLVLDRNRIHEGETAVLTVVLSGVSLAGGRVETYHSDTLLFRELKGPDSDHLRQYAIYAPTVGEYSILVRATVKAETDTEVPRHLLNRSVALTVVEKERGIVSGNAGVIIGTILGAILGVVGSFFGVYFKDVVEGWSANRNRFLWLSNELVGRLEAAKLDIRNQRNVNYQSWIEELYSKHFSALRKWDATPEVGEGLSRDLIQIEGLLREYNQSLSSVAADDELIVDLNRRIDQVQKVLTRRDD